MADDTEFDAFVVARSPALLRTAYLLVRDQALAEDLLQTSLTKTWFAWSRIHGDPEPYVRPGDVDDQRVLVARRWKGEVPTADLPDLPSGAEATGDSGDLWEALGHLPRRQRAVVVLRYYEDLTEAETAKLLDCSVGTVKSQCAKALAKMRLDSALAPVTDEGSRS